MELSRHTCKQLGTIAVHVTFGQYFDTDTPDVCFLTKPFFFTHRADSVMSHNAALQHQKETASGMPKRVLYHYANNKDAYQTALYLSMITSWLVAALKVYIYDIYLWFADST